MHSIKALSAVEILDSRGRPTVQVTCVLDNGSIGTTSVPSGASTGSAEAHELRDGDPTRYRGLGCLQAVKNVETELFEALRKLPLDQTLIDQTMSDLDGTANKSRLGANAILGVSLAFAKAAAHSESIPLYEYFARLVSSDLYYLPRPTINLFSGGKHAGSQVALQDLLLVPQSANTMRDALAMVVEIYQCAAEIVYANYSMRLLTADEGGLAPPFSSTEEMLSSAMEAIHRAGLKAGEDVALAIDVAASHFYRSGVYSIDGHSLSTTGMINMLVKWTQTYPIISIEDGLHEEDWIGWSQLNEQLGENCLILGDDLLCTNPSRIEKAIAHHAANALLLKVNQIGTLSEALFAFQQARKAGWHVTISARSGETEDNWLADLAVGWQGDHLKIGSVTQSDRLAKYNRVLTIEAETNCKFN